MRPTARFPCSSAGSDPAGRDRSLAALPYFGISNARTLWSQRDANAFCKFLAQIAQPNIGSVTLHNGNGTGSYSMSAFDPKRTCSLIGIEPPIAPRFFLAVIRCPLLALSGHATATNQCPLLGVKRPKRTSEAVPPLY
jgi:hypothetical protein